MYLLFFPWLAAGGERDGQQEVRRARRKGKV